MADIEIGPLADSLADEEIAQIEKQLVKLGAPAIPKSDDDTVAALARGVDDDVLAEFLDRLEAYDIACDIYLPSEFEGRIEIGDLRIGSSQALLDVLEEMKDELAPADEDDEDDEDEEDDDGDADDDSQLELIDAQIRRLWKVIYDGAQVSMERKLPLYVRSA